MRDDAPRLILTGGPGTLEPVHEVTGRTLRAGHRRIRTRRTRLTLRPLGAFGTLRSRFTLRAGGTSGTSRAPRTSREHPHHRERRRRDLHVNINLRGGGDLHLDINGGHDPTSSRVMSPHTFTFPVNQVRGDASSNVSCRSQNPASGSAAVCSASRLTVTSLPSTVTSNSASGSPGSAFAASRAGRI